jgi:hypothetical protein
VTLNNTPLPLGSAALAPLAFGAMDPAADDGGIDAEDLAAHVPSWEEDLNKLEVELASLRREEQECLRLREQLIHLEQVEKQRQADHNRRQGSSPGYGSPRSNKHGKGSGHGHH